MRVQGANRRETNNMSGDIVYVVSQSGHRQQYLDLLSRELGLTPAVGPVWPSHFWALLRAEKLLLATLDDHLVSFAALCILRRLAGRRTVGLFLRFKGTVYENSMLQRLKRLAFKGLKRLKGVGIVSILPFSINPRFAEVATDGVCDPQLWDMHDGHSIKPLLRNSFYDYIKVKARGRTVVALPGSLTRIKGFGLMAEILSISPEICEDVFFVAAGRVDEALRTQAKAFSANGGLLVDRRITDEELEGLYAASNLIWCCYTPDYDQASGIFGRAIQFGRTPIVRRGSLIDTFAQDFGADAIPVDIDDLPGLALRLARKPDFRSDTSPDDRHRAARIGALRAKFFEVLADRLDGTPYRARLACQQDISEKPKPDASPRTIDNSDQR